MTLVPTKYCTKPHMNIRLSTKLNKCNPSQACYFSICTTYGAQHLYMHHQFGQWPNWSLKKTSWHRFRASISQKWACTATNFCSKIWPPKNIVGTSQTWCFLNLFNALNPNLDLVWPKKFPITRY